MRETSIIEVFSDVFAYLLLKILFHKAVETEYFLHNKHICSERRNPKAVSWVFERLMGEGGSPFEGLCHSLYFPEK